MSNNGGEWVRKKLEAAKKGGNEQRSDFDWLCRLQTGKVYQWEIYVKGRIIRG
jgi:hypothetical protein